MDKRKNGVHGKKRLTKWGLFAIFAVGMAFISFALLKTGGNCFDVNTVDYVMYGVDGDRWQWSESRVVLDVLGSMRLDRTNQVFPYQYGGTIDDMQKPIDMAFYSGFHLVGTVWVLHSDLYDQWYVQINDANRHDCGMYAVPWDVVDALTDDLASD